MALPYSTIFIVSLLLISTIAVLYTLSPNSNSTTHEKLSSALLKSSISKEGCRSRTQYYLYSRIRSDYQPSLELTRRLREYEELHARCADKAEALLSTNDTNECQFVVWISNCGLGNKIVTLVSAFLYALLTNRVLLVDSRTNLDKIFCEPFPRSTWVFPKRFADVLQVDESSPIKFGYLLHSAGGGKCIDGNASAFQFPKVVYANLAHTYDGNDMKFFCEVQQQMLREQVPWLLVKSNLYFVPGLYLVPSFRNELERLFPQQEAIFQLLVRYLMHPSDPMWAMITRYYDAYLAGKDVLGGIQIRTLPALQEVHEDYASKIFQCAVENNLLPNVSADSQSSIGCRRSIATVVTSLEQRYYDALKDVYLRNSTRDGSCVRVLLPSHEDAQKTELLEHDQKAAMEMYVLSLGDFVITSPGSTFGYVAQGVGGLKPWLMKSEKERSHGNATCFQLSSPEPCFHAPAAYVCNCQPAKGPAEVIDNIQGCEDVPGGIKLKSNYKPNTTQTT